MKQNKFLSMAVIAVLMVVAVGCTTMQGTQDDGYYDTQTVQTAPSRIYVDDPNRYGRTIVMERDPFTGRYYEVNPYGSVYSQGYSTYPTYDPRYNNRVSSNRRYDSRRSNSGFSNRGQVYQQQAQQPTEQQRRESEQKRKDAKDAILGKKN